METITLMEKQEIKIADIIKQYSEKFDLSKEYELEVTEIKGYVFLLNYNKDLIEENVILINKPTTLIVQGNSPQVFKTYYNTCAFSYFIKKPVFAYSY